MYFYNDIHFFPKYLIPLNFTLTCVLLLNLMSNLFYSYFLKACWIKYRSRDIWLLIIVIRHQCNSRMMSILFQCNPIDVKYYLSVPNKASIKNYFILLWPFKYLQYGDVATQPEEYHYLSDWWYERTLQVEKYSLKS